MDNGTGVKEGDDVYNDFCLAYQYHIGYSEYQGAPNL
jgi:hypothetical protein